MNSIDKKIIPSNSEVKLASVGCKKRSKIFYLVMVIAVAMTYNFKGSTSPIFSLLNPPRCKSVFC